MSLTPAERYLASSTLYLYNQILNVHFYSILYKGRSLLVAWDSSNDLVTQIFGEWNYEDDDENDGEEDDVDDLNELILNAIEEIEENDLTNKDKWLYLKEKEI